MESFFKFRISFQMFGWKQIFFKKIARSECHVDYDCLIRNLCLQTICCNHRANLAVAMAVIRSGTIRHEICNMCIYTYATCVPIRCQCDIDQIAFCYISMDLSQGAHEKLSFKFWMFLKFWPKTENFGWKLKNIQKMNRHEYLSNCNVLYINIFVSSSCSN